MTDKRGPKPKLGKTRGDRLMPRLSTRQETAERRRAQNDAKLAAEGKALEPAIAVSCLDRDVRLIAAARQATPGADIRLLEWEITGRIHGTPSAWTASGILHYFICSREALRVPGIVFPRNGNFWLAKTGQWFDTIDAAKAAAQTDYAQRLWAADSMSNARKARREPPVPQSGKHYTLIGNAALAKLCMRVLWLREHALERLPQTGRRLSVEASVKKFLDDNGGDPDLLPRLLDMINKNQIVRQLDDGEQLRGGEIEVLYRPLDWGSPFDWVRLDEHCSDAPIMRFAQKI